MISYPALSAVVAGKALSNVMQATGNGGGGNIDKQSIPELEKSIKSFKKLVAEYQAKLANPDKNINPSEIKGDPQKYREGLIDHWQQDLDRNQLYLEQAKNRLMELKAKSE